MAVEIKLYLGLLPKFILFLIITKYSANGDDFYTNFTLPEFKFTHVDSLNSYSYDDVTSRMAKIKEALYNNVTQLTDNEAAPPRGSRMEENQDLGYIELVTRVVVYLSPDRIVMMDVEQQSLTLQVKETFLWQDEGLTWENPPGEVPVDSVLLNASDIWIPSVYADNIVDEVTVIDTELVTVWRDGVCYFSRVMHYSIPCSVSIDSFPFDQHNCSFDYKQVSTIHNRIAFVDFGSGDSEARAEGNIFSGNKYAHLEWQGLKFDKNILGDVKDSFRVSVLLQRHATFYAVVLIFPTVLLNLLSLVVFTLPINNTERENFALTLILTYFVLVMIIVDTSPPTGDQMPKLGLYVILCAVVVVIIFGMSLLLIEMHEHKRAKKAKMPTYLSRFLTSFCGLEQYLNSRLSGTAKGYSINSEDRNFSDKKSNSLLQLDVDNNEFKKVDPLEREEFKWKYLAKILNIVFFVITLMAHILLACLMFIKL